GVARRGGELEAELARLEARREGVAALRQRAEDREAERGRLRDETVAGARAARVALEKVAGDRASSIQAAIVESELDDARRSAAQLVRSADAAPAEEAARASKRIMGIAVG